MARETFTNYKIYLDENGMTNAIENKESGQQYHLEIKITPDYDLIANCDCKDFLTRSNIRNAPCKHCYIGSFLLLQGILTKEKPTKEEIAFVLKNDEGLDKFPMTSGLLDFVSKFKDAESFSIGEIVEKAVKKETKPISQVSTNTRKLQSNRVPMKKPESFVSPYGDIPEQFVIKIMGKPYVRQEGLIVLAKKIGLQSVRTKPIQWSHESRDKKAIFKATVTFKDGSEYEAYGVASPENVKADQFLKHLDHLAETRSRCRALRLALASGLVAVEELTTPKIEELENYG
jgi:hypothetical protein